MSDVLSQLLDLLDLERIEENIYRGESRDTGQRSVFGGQVLGQALAAACKTVDADRFCHSMHAYFLRPGDIRHPIVYDVDCIRNGKSFATRRVNAIQHGRAIFSMSASFQTPEDGLEHQVDMPDVPGPEDLPTENEVRKPWVEHLPEKIRKQVLAERPIDIRHIDPVHIITPEKREPVKRFWFKTIGRLPDDVFVHQALLAFASDFGLMGTAMMPHGLSFFTPNVQAASLDHSMWFVRPFRMDEWLLYDMDSPSSSGARGMNFGRIYKQDGTLVATVAQEGLQRLRGTDDNSV